MKRKRQNSPRHTMAMERTEVWHHQLQQALPSALVGALTSKRALQDWATGIGMAVLTGLVEAGNRGATNGSPPSADPPPAKPKAAVASRRAAPASPRRVAPVSPAVAVPSIMEGVAVGDLLLDKYKVERLIGIGGMGVVLAAQHIHLKKRVAIKLLQPDAWQNLENVSRFIREAQLVAKMQSPHVVRMFDVGTLDSGIPYMVMEYLEGKDLFEWMQDRGQPSVSQAVGYILQACEAIAEAHAFGIVHRDLKPANLFCTFDLSGEIIIKVLDFGISKVMESSAEQPETVLTQFQVVLGSPPYMSPEQAWSTRDVDGRTDIWSLGVILYEMLTGDLPFVGRSDLDLRKKITTQPPLSIHHRRPGIPRALEQVVFKCLEKNRDDRYATVDELVVALRPYSAKAGQSGALLPAAPRTPSAMAVLAMAAALALSVSGEQGPSSTPSVSGGQRCLTLDEPTCREAGPLSVEPRRRLDVSESSPMQGQPTPRPPVHLP